MGLHQHPLWLGRLFPGGWQAVSSAASHRQRATVAQVNQGSEAVTRERRPVPALVQDLGPFA